MQCWWESVRLPAGRSQPYGVLERRSKHLGFEGLLGQWTLKDTLSGYHERIDEITYW